MKNSELIFSVCSGLLTFSQQVEANIPNLTLANTYHTNLDLSDYYISEKFDGIRAYWDGVHLISRQGNIIEAPDFFIEKLPEFPVDGELWLQRNSFQELISIVKNSNKKQEWNRVIYKIFDAPKQVGTYDERLLFLQTNLILSPSVELVEQSLISDEKTLYKELKRVESLGGEGLILHQISTQYIGKRGDQLLKLKSYSDDEAVVLGIMEGKGKYKGMMGAVWVKNSAGKLFKIGSGFSDFNRRFPPQIGEIVTYRYNGLTDRGIPKFVRFLRVRDPNE